MQALRRTNGESDGGVNGHTLPGTIPLFSHNVKRNSGIFTTTECTNNSNNTMKMGTGDRRKEFTPDDLPDGICISPKRMLSREDQDDNTAVRDAQYTGSFAVVGDDQASRAEFVRAQLTQMTNITKTKPVLLVISLSGIKVCSSSGESVYMAHALKRISYATCDPENSQFSFLAREPKGQTNVQYCHAFRAASPTEAEDLNTIVGNAFKMAYAVQHQNTVVSSSESLGNTGQPQQPTFHELIQQQLQVKQEEYELVNKQKQEELTKQLTLISTAKIAERVRERNEKRSREMERMERDRDAVRLQGKDRMSWAKHIAGKTRHRIPFMDDPTTTSMSTSTVTSSASHRVSTLSSTTNGSDTSSHHFSSIAAIKDAFHAGELRAYGSPVMTLKETIDNHFIDCAQRGDWAGIYNGDGKEKLTRRRADEEKDVSQETYPSAVAANEEDAEASTSSTSLHSQTSSPGHITQRPLPATPELRHKKKKSKSKRSSRPNSAVNKTSPERTQSSDDGSPLPPGSRSSVVQRNESRSSMIEHDESRSSMIEHNESGPIIGVRNDSRSSMIVHDDPPLPPPGRQPDEALGPISLEVQVDDCAIYQGPPTPQRYDSLRKLEPGNLPPDEEHLGAPWYQAGVPREVVLELLGQEEIGSFIVRDSGTHPGCYALSVKVPKFDNPAGISHYLIMRTSRGGYRLKGLEKEWSSLTALVTHHTVMPEMLPCTLRLPRKASNFGFRDCDRDDKDEDDDYQRLSDFSHMMHDLKL